MKACKTNSGDHISQSRVNSCLEYVATKITRLYVFSLYFNQTCVFSELTYISMIGFEHPQFKRNLLLYVTDPE